MEGNEQVAAQDLTPPVTETEQAEPVTAEALPDPPTDLAGDPLPISMDPPENQFAGDPAPVAATNTGIVGNLQDALKRCTIVCGHSRGQHQTMNFKNAHLAAHALELVGAPTDGTHLVLNAAGQAIPLDGKLADYVRTGEKIKIVVNPEHTPPPPPIGTAPIINVDHGFGKK